MHNIQTKLDHSEWWDEKQGLHLAAYGNFFIQSALCCTCAMTSHGKKHAENQASLNKIIKFVLKE